MPILTAISSTKPLWEWLPTAMIAAGGGCRKK
jgi:hypothetical protein